MYNNLMALLFRQMVIKIAILHIIDILTRIGTYSVTKIIIHKMIFFSSINKNNGKRLPKL